MSSRHSQGTAAAESSQHTLWVLLLGSFTILFLKGLITLVRNRYRPVLKDIPGPFLASISDLDRLWSCAGGLQMKYHQRLHDKYGPIVRTGPNHVSFADGSVIPQIYNIATKFVKSDFYKMYDVQTPAGVTPSTFSVRNEEMHKAMKKPSAPAYTMSSMKELEPMNDECSAILIKKMEKYVGQDINLGNWLHWYAIDVIMSLTFSARLGFMEHEKDVDNIIEAMEARQKYNSIIGQAPWLHKYLFGNPFVAWLASFIPSVAIMNSSKRIIAFTQQNIQQYRAREEQKDGGPLDMLARFKRFKDGEEVMSDSELLMHTSGNIFAGSDTTAATLRSLFYYLSRSPTTLRTLHAELQTNAPRLSTPITFTESQSLPYLQAVIKESSRMHPAVGLSLERIVPPSPPSLLGITLPPGTVVGVNPWIAARETSVYGPDAYTFRPERWLEAEQDPEKLRLMERNFLSFGAGARTCLGRNVSLLEMSKVVPELVRRFEFDVQGEWRLFGYWFCWQKGVVCRVRRRGEADGKDK